MSLKSVVGQFEYPRVRVFVSLVLALNEQLTECNYMAFLYLGLIEKCSAGTVVVTVEDRMIEEADRKTKKSEWAMSRL